MIRTLWARPSVPITKLNLTNAVQFCTPGVFAVYDMDVQQSFRAARGSGAEYGRALIVLRREAVRNAECRQVLLGGLQNQ